MNVLPMLDANFMSIERPETLKTRYRCSLPSS